MYMYNIYKPIPKQNNPNTKGPYLLLTNSIVYPPFSVKFIPNTPERKVVGKKIVTIIYLIYHIICI